MKVLVLPVALPGKCIVCGASDNVDGRKYIDFGFEIDFYGVVYFCSHCFNESAVAIGYHSDAFYQPLIDENRSLLRELAELSAENVKLRVALSQLNFLGSNDTSISFDPGIEESIDTERSDDSKSVKPSDEPGRTNISKAGKSKPPEDLDLDDIDI